MSLSPIRRHAIIYTNAGLLLIGPQGTNFKQKQTKTKTNFNQNSKRFVHENASENVVFEIGGHFVRGGGDKFSFHEEHIATNVWTGMANCFKFTWVLFWCLLYKEGNKRLRDTRVRV